MKKLSILFSFVFVFAALFAFQANAQEIEPGEGGNDKACVLTVPNPDEATITCNGTGTICSSMFDCLGVFKPRVE